MFVGKSVLYRRLLWEITVTPSTWNLITRINFAEKTANEKCHHQYTICITIFRCSTIIKPWLLKTFVAYVNNQLHVLKPRSIIKIVVFDNKINHPGKRHKYKTFVAWLCRFFNWQNVNLCRMQKVAVFFWWFFMGKQEMHLNNILSSLHYINDEQKDIY